MPKYLENKIFAITRKKDDAREFAQLVSSEGGKTIALSTIDIVPKDPSVVVKFIDIINKKKHDYCAFMSQQAVDILFDLANRIDKTSEVISILNSRTIVAVGPKTRQSLIDRAIDVKLLPRKYSSQGLVDLFSKIELAKTKKILIPRSAASNEFTKKALSGLGMTVDELNLYTIQTSRINSVWKDFALLIEQKKVDSIVFTSASAVQSFFEIMQKISLHNTTTFLNDVKAIISIGPFTTEELRKRNIRPFEAHEHTMRGTFELAKAILSGK
jgi:uroporphyrinogen-III synthase